MPICVTCKIDKPTTAYSTNKKAKRGECKSCRNVKERKNYSRNKDRARQLKYRYGITVEEYQKWYDKLDGKCQICGKHQKLLYVDHDHKTMAVRGLLCPLCNAFLGKVDADGNILDKVRTYYHGGHHKG